MEQVRATVDDVWDDVRRRRLPLAEHVALDTDDGVRAVLAELERHKVVGRYSEGPETVFVIDEDQHLAAAFYRNTVVHFFLAGALAQTALARVVTDPGEDPLATFWDAVMALRDLLKFDFFFEGREELRAAIEHDLDAQDLRWRELVAAGPDATQGLLESYRPLTAFTVLRSFLESYAVVAAALVNHQGRDVSDDELMRRCRHLGRQYLLQRRIHSPESIASPLFRNALELARSRGLIGGEAGPAERHAYLDEVRRALRDIDLVELLATVRVQALIDGAPAPATSSSSKRARPATSRHASSSTGTKASVEQARWSSSTSRTAASGIAAASARCSLGGIARSSVVTMTLVGTSTSPIQRRESKRQVACPASSTWRMSCRRISAAAHRRIDSGRPAAKGFTGRKPIGL